MGRKWSGHSYTIVGEVRDVPSEKDTSISGPISSFKVHFCLRKRRMKKSFLGRDVS